MDTGIALTTPLDFQVVQRRSWRSGTIPVAGAGLGPCDRVEVKLSGRTMSGKAYTTPWLAAEYHPDTGTFHLDLPAPAGGWYALQVRALAGGAIVATARVPHVGVGEVFVGAGQSNSTSCGGLGSTSRLDGRTKTKTRRVSSFDGSRWRLADDPQSGAHDLHDGGSLWPAFGDAMAARYRVPIGVAVTGHAGTSIRQWTPKDALYHWTLARLRCLGTGGFRALLWHQGENDADTRMDTDSYATGLAEILQGWRAELGDEFPAFVALATFIPWPQGRISPEIRAAQRALCERGLALEGPDTDTLRGDLRDNGGTGIHFSRKGLKAHGEAWAEKVAAWLDTRRHTRQPPAPAKTGQTASRRNRR